MRHRATGTHKQQRNIDQGEKAVPISMLGVLAVKFVSNHPLTKSRIVEHTFITELHSFAS